MVEHEGIPGALRVLAAGDGAADERLERLLHGEGFELMTSSGVEEAMRIVRSAWSPEVVLLDLPEDERVSLCERIRVADQVVVIVALGASSSEEEIRSLEAGADDYVAKPYSPALLLARIRANLRGRPSAERQVFEFGDLHLDVRNYVTRVKGEWVDLRPQEFRLLVALARAHGDPLSRKELVLRSGARWRGASSRTVDVNISRIRTAIESPSDYTYVHGVRGRGYRFEPVPKESFRVEARQGGRSEGDPASG
jgi:DNA-binding response OmpR family regulator